MKHDTAAHVAAGGFGVAAPGCPRCEADGGYYADWGETGRGKGISPWLYENTACVLHEGIAITGMAEARAHVRYLRGRFTPDRLALFASTLHFDVTCCPAAAHARYLVAAAWREVGQDPRPAWTRLMRDDAPHCDSHIQFRSDCNRCVSEREFG